MTRAKLLQPDLTLGKTITHLSPEILRFYHLKGLVLDVDETLVSFKETDVSDELHDWLAKIRPILPIWLVSNNISENRIGRIAKSVNLPYLFGAGKPSRRKLRHAVQHMDLPVSQVAMVGDRLFTDVLAGNRLGMFTILVEPIVESGEVARSYSVRNLEVWISKQLGVSLHHAQHDFQSLKSVENVAQESLKRLG